MSNHITITVELAGNGFIARYYGGEIVETTVIHETPANENDIEILRALMRGYCEMGIEHFRERLRERAKTE